MGEGWWGRGGGEGNRSYIISFTESQNIVSGQSSRIKIDIAHANFKGDSLNTKFYKNSQKRIFTKRSRPGHLI